MKSHMGFMAGVYGALLLLVFQEFWLSKTLPCLHVASRIDQGTSIEPAEERADRRPCSRLLMALPRHVHVPFAHIPLTRTQ